jgi:hypothetical protein
VSVDIDNLRRAIELGTVEACHDAGFERVAIRVVITALACVDERTGEPMVVPAIHVEVCEMTPEQVKEILASDPGRKPSN